MSTNRPRLWSALALAAVCLAWGGTAQSEPEPDGEGRASPDAEPADASEPSTTRRALAVGASVVPGVVVHGAGSFVLGDDASAKRLLLMEGAGLGLAAGSLAGLAATGAARSLAGLFIVTGLAGGSLVGLSFAADVYHVLAPPEGLGVPRRTPWFESQVGYVYVDDPVFDYAHFVESGFHVQPGPVGFGVQTMHAPLQGNSRVRLEPSFRVWQPAGHAGQAEGSFVDVVGGAALHRFDVEGFSTNTLELGARTRLDSERVLPNVHGAFGEFWVGYGWAETRFPDYAAVSHDTLLLGGFGFGMYLGRPGAAGGEVTLYYDHRHDDFAAGLKAAGLGSGVLGHFGARSRYYLSEHWGLAAGAEVGSALVLGLGVAFRMERGPTLHFY